MSTVSLKINDFAGFQSSLNKSRETIRKAAINAAKVEAYRLTRELQREIREGAPGGEKFEPLTILRGMGQKRFTPLKGLARVPKYAVMRKGSDTKIMFGFLGIKSSRKYSELATKLQDGFSTPSDSPTPVGSTYRKLFATIGGRLKSKAIKKYFFLRKTTVKLVTPKRMIIVPFWRAHRSEAEANVVSNFERKLRGERI